MLGMYTMNTQFKIARSTRREWGIING
jgi:hypothetical protein